MFVYVLYLLLPFGITAKSKSTTDSDDVGTSNDFLEGKAYNLKAINLSLMSLV